MYWKWTQQCGYHVGVQRQRLKAMVPSTNEKASPDFCPGLAIIDFGVELSQL